MSEVLPTLYTHEVSNSTKSNPLGHNISSESLPTVPKNDDLKQGPLSCGHTAERPDLRSCDGASWKEVSTGKHRGVTSRS